MRVMRIIMRIIILLRTDEHRYSVTGKRLKE